ncbi:hypothetical protein [Stutzerimonas nitrititolerans]|uniref:hypothetical protein n=1 Tax=Stutzerimonas nitrititolerans TaxID=2482751 RepID=UPI0028AF5A44|nr:hypothetical protein [Stutzerimonas nitrititolerans]
MRADLQELVVLSQLCPAMVWTWRKSSGRHVIVASEGSVIHIYWMPALLCLDEFRAQLFIQELNATREAGLIWEG